MLVFTKVCDFLDTSSKNSVSTYNQPNLESTQNQPSFFCLKFWALLVLYQPSALCTEPVYTRGVHF
jgi:hypothetical protein